MPNVVEAADNRRSQTIFASDVRVVQGEQAKIKATSRSSRSYSSDNPSIATVTKDGVVTGKKAGTTYVTIKATGTKLVCPAVKKIKVVVTAPPYVILRSNQGKEIRRIRVGKSHAVTLPSIEDPKGYTFVGWSRTPHLFVSETNQVTSWESGYTLLNISTNINLYAVLSRNSEERNIAVSALPKPNLSKYSAVVFVGDSRTAHLHALLRNEKYDMSHVYFVSRPGGTINWLQANGYRELLRQLKSIQKDSAHPVAVVFNMGVNDMTDQALYLTYMKKIAPTLKQQNCRLFYMSVNPYNVAQNMKYHGTQTSFREDGERRVFNNALKKGLAADYTYIDTCAYLLRSGYRSDHFDHAVLEGVDDGLHFGDRTYKRIFNMAMNLVNKS